MEVDDSMNRKEGDGMDIDIVSPPSSPHLPSVHEHEPTSFSTALSQPVHPHSHSPPHPGNPNSFHATATASPSPSAPHPSSPSQVAAFPGPGRRSGVTRPLAAYKDHEHEHKDNSETKTKTDIDRKGWPSSSSSPPPRGDHQQHSPVSPEQEADSSETSERTRTAQIILSLAASASASDSARNSSYGGFGPRSLPPLPLALGASSSASRTGAGGKDEKHTGPSESPGDRSKEASLGRPRGGKEASSPTNQSFLRLVQEGPFQDTAATKTLAPHGGRQLALGQPLRAFLDLAILSDHGVDLGPAYVPQSSSLPLASASTPFFRLPSASNSLSSSGRARPTPIPLTLAGAHRHSPYPPSSRSASFHIPATATVLPPMPVTSGASGPPSTPSRSASHAGGQSQAQFTPPSMSSSARRRRGPVPDWPSPKAISPGQTSAYGPSRGDGSAAAFALQTPTPLRVPQSAALRSPALTAQHSAIRPPPPPLPPVYHYAAAPRSAPLRERQHRGIAASAPIPSSPRVAAPLPIPATPRTPASAQRARLVQRSPTMASVVKELNGRAGDYWTSPESADVRIIIPVLRTAKTPRTADPQLAQRSLWPSTPSFPGSTTGRRGSDHGHPEPPSAGWGGERRGSLPSNMDIPVLVFPLHSQYLIPQSALFRSLLSSLKPVTEASISMPRSAGLGPSMPMVKGARVLPHKKGEPTTIYLPIPDPTSFGVLVHWLYWGDIPALESALSRGLVTWQGVVKNIEYLSLDDSVKRVLGKWWRTWIKTDVGRGPTGDGARGEMQPRPGSPITLPPRAASENAKRVPPPPGLQELSDDSESPRSRSGRDGEAAADGDDEGMEGDDGGVAERLEAL